MYMHVNIQLKVKCSINAYSSDQKYPNFIMTVIYYLLKYYYYFTIIYYNTRTYRALDTNV